MIILGAEGEIKDIDGFVENLRRLSDEKNIEIQVFDADLVCGREHVISASKHAIRAFKEGRNSMRRLSMEIMLYMAGERQIGDAIGKVGIKDRNKRFVFLFLDSRDFERLKGKISYEEAIKMIREFGMKRNDNVMKVSREKLVRFGLKEEIDTVSKDKYGDLILEKVAMVDIIK